MLEERKGEFRHLFREFAESYFDTPDGRRDLGMYDTGRQQAQENVREILQARDRGEDITDLVLLKLLPYTDTAPNRSKGAWVSIAPAVTGDVRAWFQNVGFTKADDWPRVAEAILQFVLRCIEDPAELSSACAEFSGLPYSKGFQSGMLTPILNALRPDDYALINNKPRQVINHFAGTDYGQPLLDYPTLNQAFQQLVGDLAEDMHRLAVPEMRDGDLFDAFCHWLVAVKKYHFSTRHWKVAPGEKAWNWEACRDGGFIAMGWDDLGDISDLNQQQFEAKRDEVAQSREHWGPYGANQVWTFAREMKVGDRVVANRGTTEVLGIGTVTGEYYYVPGVRHGYRRSVHWDDQAHRRVNEGGWRRTMVELDKDKFEVIRHTPPRETLFSNEAVRKLLALNERCFPGWTGFDDPRFVGDEVTYKQESVTRAEELINQGELQRLIENGEFKEVLGRLQALGRDNNLLWYSQPSRGDLNILHAPDLDKPSFCRVVQDLLYGEGPTSERLGRYLDYVRAQDLPDKWTFPTYFLFFCYPDQEMFVKPYAARWLFQFLGRPNEWNWKANLRTYEYYKAMVSELKGKLASYGPRNLMDVQGFLWTCYSENRKGPSLAEPFSLIFEDRDEAEWAFGLMRKVLDRAGVPDQDDERYVLSLRATSQRGYVLRLILGNWVLMGIRGPSSVERRLELPLLRERAEDLEDYRVHEYKPDPGQPQVDLYRMPVELVREDEAMRGFWEAVDVAGLTFGHWERSPIRSVHQPAIALAVFKPSELSGLLSRGVKLPPAVERYFTEDTLELLSRLHETPRLQFYSDHKEEFLQHLEGPFKQLLADVSAQLPPAITEMMETKKRVFARIPKNDYGRGGAWDSYWGAFYPKGSKRTADAQLIVWMNRDVLQFGFSIGDYGQEPRQRFWRNMQQHRGPLGDIVAEAMGGGDFKFGEGGDQEESFDAWLRTPQPFPRALMSLSAEEVLSLSTEELTARVVGAFAALFPLVLLATLDEPLPAIERFLGIEPDVDDVPPVYTLDDCATDTGFDRADLELWLAAIEHKRQAMLYGPPGTGKTYLAKQLARHIVGGSDGFWEVVQFHPAYAYEDFVQGIRPQSGGDGQLDYPVLPGRFLRFCSKAAGRRGRCVLIIDEINRANLARVFGELMYLLEYRDETVALAVDGRSFSIPENVRLIGTMNTADRSIALVDHALRRRFAFIGLWPNYGVLRSWHEKETGFNTDGLIAVLERLNREIGDPNYHVGISFFLVQNPTALFEGIWRMEIEPYLEEYFFDQRETVHQFRWDQVKGEVLGQ